jgi:hypothetical protein
MTMTVEEAAEAAKGMTFEKVWLYMQETTQETQKQFREVQQEISNLTKTIDNQSKNIDGINNTIGKITEAIFLPEIHEKFKAFGYNFNDSSTSPNKIFRHKGQAIAEADIYLENGAVSMIIEVKTKLTQTDIDDHIERIETLRSYFDKMGNNRNILGAIAGTIISNNLINYAYKNGLFVLVQSGESVKIADMPEGFKPRTW